MQHVAIGELALFFPALTGDETILKACYFFTKYLICPSTSFELNESKVKWPLLIYEENIILLSFLLYNYLFNLFFVSSVVVFDTILFFLASGGFFDLGDSIY